MTAAAEPLVLYTEGYWLSPWDCACWVALREKGLPFARSLAIVPGAGLQDGLRAHAIAARIPTLQHGDFWLSESAAIVEYLEDVFPAPPVLPRAARERARARQLSQWTRSELHELRAERPAWMIFYAAAPPPLGTAARAEADELVEAAVHLLAGRPAFLFGDFTVTDVDLALALQRLRRTAHDLPAELVGYVDRVWVRASVREYVLHPRPPNPPPEDINTRR